MRIKTLIHMAPDIETVFLVTMSFCINHTDTRYTFCFHVICRAFTSYDISIHVLVVGIFCLEEVESRNWLYGCRSSWIFQRNFALPVPPLSAAQLLSGLRPTFPAFAFFMTSFTYPMVYRHCLYFSWQTFIICMFLGKPSLSACVTGVRVPQTAIGCL